jgi:hypothetical protein
VKPIRSARAREINKKKKTISVIDRGIGMTEDEIDKYINQIAFSSAEEFIAKYEEAGENKLIGQFGFKSGREIDKFEGVNFKIGRTGTRIVLDNSIAYLEAEVIEEMEVGTKPSKTAVNANAKAADSMPHMADPGTQLGHVEDLGGPDPSNYRPDDDSAKLKTPGATLKQVKDVVNKGAKPAMAMASVKEDEEIRRGS